MAKDNTVILTLPESTFEKLLDGNANADILTRIAAAFQAASHALDCKEKRNPIRNALDMSSGQVSAPVADVKSENVRSTVYIRNF
jgi:hypothetical protein